VVVEADVIFDALHVHIDHPGIVADSGLGS
jgi:hypothetical protein